MEFGWELSEFGYQVVFFVVFLIDPGGFFYGFGGKIDFFDVGFGWIGLDRLVLGVWIWDFLGWEGDFGGGVEFLDGGVGWGGGLEELGFVLGWIR